MNPFDHINLLVYSFLRFFLMLCNFSLAICVYVKNTEALIRLSDKPQNNYTISL